MKNKSLLTVILPNYNHAEFLEKTLNDIISQSYHPKEIIVVDDGSSDNSIEIIQRVKTKHSNIKFLINDKNEGIFISTKRALDIASGEFFYFAGADDIIYPGLFEKSVGMLNRYAGAGLCSSASESVEVDGTRTRLVGRNFFDSERFIDSDECGELLQTEGAWMGGCTTIYRREAYLFAGGFNANLGPYCDIFLQMTVALKFGVCFIPESLGCQRISDGSYSAKDKSNFYYFRGIYKTAENLMSNEYRDLYTRNFIESWKSRELYLLYLSSLNQARKKEMLTTLELLKNIYFIDRIFLLIINLFAVAKFSIICIYLYLRNGADIRFIFKKALMVKFQRLRYKLILVIKKNSIP